MVYNPQASLSVCELQQVDKRVSDIISANHSVYSQEVPLQMARNIEGLRTVDEVCLSVCLPSCMSACLSFHGCVPFLMWGCVHRCILTQCVLFPWQCRFLTCWLDRQTDRHP